VFGLLGFILSGIELIGQYVIFGIETVINLVLVAIVAVAAFLMSLLPSMGTSPVLPGGAYVGWLNWIFPMTQLIMGLITVVGLWIGYLAVRWALRFARAL
jgi:hypothetical protein